MLVRHPHFQRSEHFSNLMQDSTKMTLLIIKLQDLQTLVSNKWLSLFNECLSFNYASMPWRSKLDLEKLLKFKSIFGLKTGPIGKLGLTPQKK